MAQRITVARLRAKSVYKFMLISMFCTLVPFGLVMGILSLFGWETVKWDDQPLTGIRGLVAGPVIGIVITLMVTAMLGSLMHLGLWLFSRFRPLILHVEPIAEGTPRDPSSKT